YTWHRLPGRACLVDTRPAVRSIAFELIQRNRRRACNVVHAPFNIKLPRGGVTMASTRFLSVIPDARLGATCTDPSHARDQNLNLPSAVPSGRLKKVVSVYMASDMWLLPSRVAAQKDERFSSSASLIIAPGREFAADSYVHTPLPDDAPIHPMSKAWVAKIVNVVTRPGSYGWTVNTHGGTPPIYIAPETQPTLPLPPTPDPPAPPRRGWTEGRLWSLRAMQPFLEAVPIPDDFVPNPGGDQSDGGDAEAVIYQPSTGKYWEGLRWFKTGKKVANSVGRSVAEWATRYIGYIGLGVDPGAQGAMSTSPGYWSNDRRDGL